MNAQTPEPPALTEREWEPFLGSVALMDALHGTYNEHVGITEPEGPSGPYIWCCCGWRSDGDLDNSNPGQSYAIHLANAQHAAAVKVLQPAVVRVVAAERILAARDAAWAEKVAGVEQEREDWRRRAEASHLAVEFMTQAGNWRKASVAAEADKARAVAEAKAEWEERAEEVLAPMFRIAKEKAWDDALARVLALVEQLDADLAAAAPAQFSNGLMRGRLKTIREAVSGRG